MNKILIVEENFRLAERLCRLFSDTWMLAQSCATLEAAAALIEAEAYQLIIVDTDLPDKNGHDIVYELGLGQRNTPRPPVILIMPGSKTSELSNLNGQGIADHITKPFNMAVLKAKVYTQIMRGSKDYTLNASERFEAIGSGSVISISGEHKVCIDTYVFDFDEREYYVAEKQVRLNRIEQCLLRTLIENKGIVLKKKALIAKLKSESKIYIDGRILHESIQTLKQKLDAKDYIKTIYAIGYIWISVEKREE